MKKSATTLLAVAATGALAFAAVANNTIQSLPFSQNWTNTALLSASDDWSGVSGIVGFRGDDVTTLTGIDPQTLTGDGTITPDVNVNIANPATQTSGGIYEAEITNPTIAFQGSGTGDAPHIVLYVNSAGKQNVRVQYQLRDIDAAADTARSQVALQFRTAPGAWTNVPAGYVSNAAAVGAGATGNTAFVDVVLPGAADNAAGLEIRIMTTNAFGNDNMVGVDDIAVTAEDIPVPANSASWGSVKAGYRK